MAGWGNKGQGTPKRFAVGAEVWIKMPGKKGIVRNTGDTPTFGEYNHKVEVDYKGEPRLMDVSGSNLELIPQPITDHVTHDVYQELRDRIAALENGQHEVLLRLVNALAAAQGTPSWQERYLEITAFASNQITAYGWLIPLLAGLSR